MESPVYTKPQHEEISSKSNTFELGTSTCSLCENDEKVVITEQTISDRRRFRFGRQSTTITWPDFFSDLVTMLDYSTLVYSINTIRDAARKGKIENIEDVFKTPIKFSELIDLLMNNHDEIIKNMPADLQYLLEPIENKLIRDSYNLAMGGGTNFGKRSVGMIGTSHERTNRSTQCVVYNDHNHKKELVYGIFLDSIKEDIIVSFRGTTTTNDILADLNGSFKTLENPIGHVNGQPEKILIYKGFYDYLFTKTESIVKASVKVNHLMGDKMIETKLDEVKRTVLDLQKENPDFSVYITGHSLGGALATLFSFFLSVESDDVIRKPISCVSFASPKTGNWDYARAFRHQELAGSLRHLRVHNHRDPIPPLPPILFPFAFRRKKLYRHVGISLLLKKGAGDYRLVLKSLVNEKKGGISSDWIHAMGNHCASTFTICIMSKFAKMHSLNEYNKRVKALHDTARNSRKRN